MQAVAALVDLDDGSRLGAFDVVLRDCLVMLRVEPFADRRVGLYPNARKCGEDPRVDQLDPGDKRSDPVLAVLSSRSTLERANRPIEIIDRRKQFMRELDDSALLRSGRFARGALAVVLEVRLRALCKLEVLVGLPGPCRKLLKVVLELRLVIGGLPSGLSVLLLFGQVRGGGILGQGLLGGQLRGRTRGRRHLRLVFGRGVRLGAQWHPRLTVMFGSHRLLALVHYLGVDDVLLLGGSAVACSGTVG